MPIINPTLPYILTNGTLADATQVMADLAAIISQVNANAVEVGSILSGSLVNLQFITTSTTYNPSVNASKALVFGQGAGAAGGGTNSTLSLITVSAGSGGGSGSRALLFIASGLTSQTVTCGAGGTGVVAGNGGNGGSSSFGGYLTLPGGIGGFVGTNSSGGSSSTPADVSASSSGFPAAPSGSGNIIFSTQGMPGEAGLALFNSIGGKGGDSWFGSGGPANSSGSGTAGTGYGAGGAGGAIVTHSAATAGFAGTGAAFLILEFA